MKKHAILCLFGAATLSLAGEEAFAACSDVDRTDLRTAANAVVDANNSGGLGNEMWVTIVNNTGKVCHVLNTAGPGDQSRNAWLGSRIISAQKANTANAFSTDSFAIATANLYTPVQSGQSFFGLQFSNPVDASTAYRGSPNTYGTNGDPLKNKRIGGVNVFGGGLALYNENGEKIGAIGVSGDDSCTDHVVAWRIREQLGFGFANVPAGVAGPQKDSMIQDITVDATTGLGVSTSGFGHPECANNPPNAADDGIVGN